MSRNPGHVLWDLHLPYVPSSIMGLVCVITCKWFLVRHLSVFNLNTLLLCEQPWEICDGAFSCHGKRVTNSFRILGHFICGNRLDEVSTPLLLCSALLLTQYLALSVWASFLVEVSDIASGSISLSIPCDGVLIVMCWLLKSFRKFDTVYVIFFIKESRRNLGY